MKNNKFSFFSVAICSLIAALWSEAQCMDPPVNEPDKSRHVAVVPTGSIISFAGEVPPHGWLLCNGKQYSNQEYPELFDVIKTKYVPDSESWIIKANSVLSEKIFCVPDLRGRVVVGVDDTAGRVTSNNTLGKSGGKENEVITIDNLPISDTRFHNRINVNHGFKIFDTSDTASKENKGVADPCNNMQPYQVLNYIINTGKKVDRRDCEKSEKYPEPEDKVRKTKEQEKDNSLFSKIVHTINYNLATENGFPFVMLGFSPPEGGHRWTDGKRATLKIPVIHNQQRAKGIIFKNTSGFVTEDHNQLVKIVCNGTPVGEYLYDFNHNSYNIDLKIPEGIDVFNIEFEMNDAISPIKLGVNEDSRTLAVAFRKVKLVTVQPL